MVDGPSAGLAMAVAIHSAITNEPIDHNAAMTGEISVNGDILPVGGIRAKVRAAERAKLKRVLIPWDNRAEAGEGKIEIIPVRTLKQALKLLQSPAGPQIPATAVSEILAASPAVPDAQAG